MLDTKCSSNSGVSVCASCVLSDAAPSWLAKVKFNEPANNSIVGCGGIYIQTRYKTLSLNSEPVLFPQFLTACFDKGSKHVGLQ